MFCLKDLRRSVERAKDKDGKGSMSLQRNCARFGVYSVLKRGLSIKLSSFGKELEMEELVFDVFLERRIQKNFFFLCFLILIITIPGEWHIKTRF